MFQLTSEEAINLRLQIAISSSGHGGRRYFTYAFTEQGVAMLSSVLSSLLFPLPLIERVGVRGVIKTTPFF